MNPRPLCILLLIAPAAHAQNVAEDAFRAAADWTVQVRTSVNRPFAEDEQGTWFGAGMLVDASRGWILTNAHVAGRSYGKVSIAFRDGRTVPARRVYVDPYLDLAVLAYDPRRLEPKSRTPTLDCNSPPPGRCGPNWLGIATRRRLCGAPQSRFHGQNGLYTARTHMVGCRVFHTAGLERGTSDHAQGNREQE